MRTLTRVFSISDRKVFYFLNSFIKCSFCDNLMLFMTKLGGVIFTSGLTLAMIIFGDDYTRLVGLKVLIALTATTVLVQILKKAVGRERPYNMLNNINTFGIEMKDYSFPSGHTAASFTIATMLYLNISHMMIPVLLLALMVGISRIYLAVHYPSDVVVGIILGSSSSIIINSHILQYIS
ncbi:phosphatase PAP2 family protein [Sporosalibacterium faouarense]|uniref:phosphatase PAP2 family protein n=1 Tax=Sporosalibacterium faouarense TaxID=516123 RepID=UPI00311CAE96